MKIVIISDAHNNLIRIKKVLDFCQKELIEGIISCGDLASRETLDFLKARFSGSIWHVLGNMDKDFLTKEIKDIIIEEKTIIYPDFGEIELDKKKIAFVHFPGKAKELFSTEKYDLVFYGHTHKPWLEKKSDQYLINPGNVAGERFSATFVFWETQKNFFKLLPVD